MSSDPESQKEVPPAADAPASPDEKPAGPPSFPEGGKDGWLAVLGGFAVLFFTWGYVNAFGVYENYYLKNQLSDRTPDDVAWIGSIQVFFMFASGIVSGPVTDRYGPQVIIWPASTLFVLSVMLTSLCDEFYQFLLCQGVLGGLSSGLCFTPALTIIGHYFFAKRAPMMAIVTTGSALGGIIFPIVLNQLLHHDGVSFGWSIRALGFIILGLCLTACATIRPRLPRRKGTFFLPSAFRQPDYTLQTVSTFLVVWGLITPFFYLPTYAETVVGVDSSLAFYLVSILNAGSFVGRMGFGIASRHLGPFNVTIAAELTSAIMVFCWIKVKSQAAVIAFTALYGATSGAVIAMMPAVMSQVAPRPDVIGTYIGMATFVGGLAGLTGTPIFGHLLSHYGRFDEAIIFSGVVLLAGTAVLVVARFFYARDKGFIV